MAEIFLDKFAHGHFRGHPAVDVCVNGRNDSIVCYSTFYPVQSFPRLLPFATKSDEVQLFHIILRKDFHRISVASSKTILVEAIDIQDRPQAYFTAGFGTSPLFSLNTVVCKVKAWAEVKVRTSDMS